uniref:Laccase n=1 Tax=Salvia miltiorrhiza TaxID=226208 RepID=A0A4Y5RR66_SALMI|nr:laccase 9 [Salvia miltiorrhiza]
MTIHWHGIRQLRTGWADGPAYITQCPVQPGESYVYNFTVSEQRGTLLWHAHILWLRATIHGAIIVLPNHAQPYPFPKPHKEEVLLLDMRYSCCLELNSSFNDYKPDYSKYAGEWWKSDVEAVIDEAMASGNAPNVSDAHTINGHPGPRSDCLGQGGYKLVVMPAKTYLLRIINAALNTELFFKIAAHNLTVVEVDAAYVKPFATDTILLAPGQTTNVLLTTDQPTARYQITASPFKSSPVTIDNTTATATVIYAGTSASAATILADRPPQNATPIAAAFTQSLRGLNSAAYPSRVPLRIDHSLLFTIGLGLADCPGCANSLRLRVVADINNVTFVMPRIALLNAHFFGIGGVFTDDFPARPAAPYDYTGAKQPENLRTMMGTRLYRLAYNSTVQVVLQGTGMLFPENHPIHLHGSNFFAVGKGLGNFNPDKDPKGFNLVDPVERNTIAVPSGGWVAIRFRADNPGVWFLHCHLEVHTSWGLKMAFVVDNGKGPNESLLPPPNDLPKC